MGYEIFKPELKRAVRGVLFDMDGLVLDSEILYTRFWREALQEMGYSMSLEQALGMRSLNKDRAQQYLESLFGPDVSYLRGREIRIRRMDAYIEKYGVNPKPGIYEILDYIDENKLPCAIATSSPLDRVQAHLEPLGLYKRFNALCSTKQAEVKQGKPEPDIYIYAASCLGLPPESCLALEDSPAGIEAAKRAGCLPVIIPDRDEPSEETLKNCFARADSLSDIRELLTELNK